jgi:spore coat protein CotH
MTNRGLLVAVLATVATHAHAQVPDLYDPSTVRDVHLTFAQTNWWSLLTQNYAPEINIAAVMTVDGITYPNVGVRFRGNTSYTQLPVQPNQGWEKKSFNISMDWLVPGQDIYGYDNLNLNNGFHDPTFIREVLTYHTMRRHGVAPKANWVRLFLNGAPWGVYINVQQPNKDMMKEWFRSNDGNRYRCFPISGGFSNGRCCYTVLSPNTLANYLTAYDAKQGDGTDLQNMCQVLNAMTTATPQTTLTSVFSVDAFYRYAAVMNVTTTTDSYLQSGKDHFLYIDDVHGDGTTFPFDLNEGMYGSSTLAPDYQTTVTTRPGFTKTLQFADWTQRYKAHLNAVIQQTFNPTHLTPLAQQYHAMLAPLVAADTKKIYSTAAFTNNLNSPVTIPNGAFGTITIPGVVPFIQSRYTFLNTNSYVNAPRATLTNLAHSPTSPNPTQPISFTVQTSALATGVNLYWRRVGPFQKVAMFDDGLHGDGAAGDGLWGVSIAAQQPGALVDYYAEARTATGAQSYEPYTAEVERYCPKVQIDWPVVASPIVINEFVAQNVTGAVDEMAQHEDWVELYNTSNQAVDISGKWLSDSLVVLKYQFPTPTTIAPNGVLRIWCDEDGTQGPLHANFKLSATGEALALYDSTGLALHESYTFGQQYADVSTGRLLDGLGPWVTFPSPTYLARNELPGCGQRTYGAITPAVHGVDLAATGTLQVGTSINYAATSGPLGGLGVAAFALAGGHIDLLPLGIGDDVLLLSPATLVLPFTVLFDGTGAGGFAFPVPPGPGIAGQRLHTQVFSLDGAGWDSSRALEITICP